MAEEDRGVAPSTGHAPTVTGGGRLGSVDRRCRGSRIWRLMATRRPRCTADRAAPVSAGRRPRTRDWVIPHPGRLRMGRHTHDRSSVWQRQSLEGWRRWQGWGRAGSHKIFKHIDNVNHALNHFILVTILNFLLIIGNAMIFDVEPHSAVQLCEFGERSK
jgi:hypothetical protein